MLRLTEKQKNLDNRVVIVIYNLLNVSINPLIKEKLSGNYKHKTITAMLAGCSGLSERRH